MNISVSGDVFTDLIALFLPILVAAAHVFVGVKGMAESLENQKYNAEPQNFWWRVFIGLLIVDAVVVFVAVGGVEVSFK